MVGRAAGYAYEENTQALSPEVEKEFRSHRKAWTFFDRQAPSWKKKILHWLTSAKQEATRERRLRKLMEACEKGRTF